MEENQYYLDPLFDKKVYNKNFNINDYKKYKSSEYYSWINSSLKNYSFPSDYSSQTFDTICDSTEYTLKPQQKFAGRIFNTLVDNKGILVYHGLGSGKTQTSIVIGEAFKFRNVKANKIIQGRTDSVVLIVVPAALVDQYYSEILGNVEDGLIKSASGQIVINGERQFYLNKKLRNVIAQNKESISQLNEKIKQGDGNINQLKEQIRELEFNNKGLYEHEKKKINGVYEILSHETFLNRLFKIKNGKYIENEQYLHLLQKRNGLLIIDEAHGLVSAIGSNYRKLLLGLRYYTNEMFRVVLLTGSPIYDKPYEFGLLMNLLRPRMIFPDGFDKFNEIFVKNNQLINKNLFKQMCSGYVSYFKGGNPEAYPYKRVIIMNHQMDIHQYSAYKNALFKEVEKDKENKINSNEEFILRVTTSESLNDEATTSVFNNSRLFCNIVFPGVEEEQEHINYSEIVNLGKTLTQQTGLTNGEYYDIGMKEYLEQNPPGKRSRQQIIQQGLNKFVKRIQDSKNVLKTVKHYSSKFAKVAEIIELSDGPVFVYSNYVFYGVEPMGAIMDALGYFRFPQKGPKGSYFIWKGQADPVEVKRAYAAFNSLKNKDGSVLKIMFGTQSVMEGVDFKRIRQIHVLDPWWNDSRMQQVIARGIRLCSHKGVPPQERLVDIFIHLSTLGSSETLYELKIYEEKLENKQVQTKIFSTLQPVYLYERDQEKWKFNVAYIKDDRVYNSKTTFKINQIVPGSIHKMSDPELTKRFGKWKQLDSISVEQYMYNRALTKLDLNRQFEMAIKESALDCDINKNGNIIRLEEHYYPEGDLFKMEYLNYSTGERYTPLQTEYHTLETIINQPHQYSVNIELKSKKDSKIHIFPPSLIIPENIHCHHDYNFNETVPQSIIDLTVNNEMIHYLKKISFENIKKFLFDVEHGNVQVSDPSLPKKIKKFYSKKQMDDRFFIIESLKEIGIGIDDDVWDFYKTEELKKIASKIIKK